MFLDGSRAILQSWGALGVKGWAGPERGAGHNVSLCGHPPSVSMSHSVHVIEVETLGACIRCELVSGMGSGPCWGPRCLASKALGSMACAQ